MNNYFENPEWVYQKCDGKFYAVKPKENTSRCNFFNNWHITYSLACKRLLGNGCFYYCLINLTV